MDTQTEPLRLHCVFKGCRQSTGRRNGVIFHSFPTNSNLPAWIAIIRKQRREPHWMPTKYSRVCTLHFNPGHTIITSKGERRIVKWAVPYYVDDIDEQVGKQPKQETSSAVDSEDQDTQVKINVDEENINQEGAIDNKMEPQDKVEQSGDVERNMPAEIDSTRLTDESNNVQEKPKDNISLDKFKRRLVRAVARHVREKKEEKQMWMDLKKEIGCDCRMLWQHMRALTLKKLKRLLPANDLLANLKKIARFNATDWLLFDLILVHEKINVISNNDGGEAEDENKEEPQCLYDLYALVKEHNVEALSGADLIEAWIRVTLQYNSSGRQCSPMMLQLRWYQLKELTRARFYNFWYAYRGNQKLLATAIKVKPTTLQSLIAKEYKTIITQTFPEWEQLIEERRVILSEEFTMHRQAKRKAENPREEESVNVPENDEEIEVIEPQVETIELEEDDVENLNDEEKESQTENNIEDINKESTSITDEKATVEDKLNSKLIANSDSGDDDVLELEGLSDVEETHIPFKKENVSECSQSIGEKCPEEGPESNDNEMLPKITNVVGNIVEPVIVTDNEELNINGEIENNNVDITTETTLVESQCTETENSETLDCNLDSETDEVLQEKESSLTNVEITQIKSECKPEHEISSAQSNTICFENMQEKYLNLVNNPSSSDNRISLSDSEEDIDKILQEKANKYMDITSQQTNEKELNENSSTVIKMDSDDMQAYLETSDKNEIIDEDVIKKEKHDDDFDEIEIDDEQIEFADDGIEFVEEIQGDKKISDVKIEPMSDSEENTTDVDDNPKIDLKLLMNPTVYTTKLDAMNVFKFTDFTSVNDKKLIECAISESKPFDKQALKEEDIKKFREEAMHGYETDGSQSDNDIVQTDEENAIDRVKSTSWLLQKPKNRNYNPIQLCKNPDFNTRLKRLTAGFMSSTRNREFLKECKPLTIDLHKAFENKLVDGTLYLKSGDFKSAKPTEADKINDNPVSVLPSAIPGQNMIFSSTSNDIELAVPNKLDSQEDNMPLSSLVEKTTCSERRKTINLPDIDQVRRFNQSLLTAEVTPIRVENKINNSNSCEESVEISVVQQPTFVQPISLEPLLKIKNEPSEENTSKLKSVLENPNYEVGSRKEVMASKIKDQIVNLSNQISEVDKELLSIDVEKTMRKQISQIKNTKGKKPLHVDKMKPPQPIKRLFTNVNPRYRGKLSWSPKYPTNHVVDSLLTTDTVAKILFVLNGDEQEIQNCSNKQKRILKENVTQEKHPQREQQKNYHETNTIQLDLTKSDKESDSPSMINPNKPSTDNTIIPKANCPILQEVPSKRRRRTKKEMERFKNNQETNAIQENLSKYNQVVDFASTSNQQGVPKRRNYKQLINSTGKYIGIYCCWAREKIVCMANNMELNPHTHGCTIYQCQCCCRHELIILATTTKTDPSPRNKKSKNNDSTIVLSDDEDMTKVTETSNENVRIAGERTPCYLVPSLAPLTKTVNHTNSANIKVNNVTVQSEIPQSNFSIAPSNVVQATNRENDMLVMPKLCKTTVHAAEGHVYNKRVESINNNSTEHIPNVPNTDINLDKETLKPHERTLYLNSNQLMNKPTRTPIFLGKNKVLLCSLKNQKVTAPPINNSLPVLPYGVNFVVSNGELTLSVDNGVQLDSQQLSTLPALMSLVHEQFNKSYIATDIQDQNIPNDNNDVTVTEKDNLNKDIDSAVENSNSTVEIHNEPTHSVKSITNVEGENAVTEDSHSNLNEDRVSLPLDNVTVAQIDMDTISNQSEMIIKDSEGLKSTENQLVTNAQIEKKITETQSVIETQVPTQSPLKSLSSSESCLNDNNASSEDNNSNTRKTILSDLMEMSGISAEDTSMVPEVSDLCVPDITPLPPNIIPVTRVSASEMVNPTLNSNESQNISIAGPYSNLFSFEPTTPLNYLLKCVAQLRPELNAVTSFAELKYVYVNGGQFYKLDVDLGTISEIKVLIKKNPQKQVDMTPKAIIDLTDDPCDVENMTCAEFHDIPQDKQNSPVKPIKLFKAIHPLILKRGRSILKGSEVVYPNKVIRISKQKRKQLLNVGNRYMLVDVEDQSAKPVDTTVNQMDSSYDSSDEEPLAKKSKRKQVTENHEENTTPLFEDTVETHNPPSISEEVVDDTDNIPDMSGDYADMSDVEINSMDIEGVNPELHPVAFEEGSESDEDNCILGV